MPALTRQRSVRLPKDVWDRIEARAEELSRELRLPITPSDVVRRAVEHEVGMHRDPSGAETTVVPLSRPVEPGADTAAVPTVSDRRRTPRVAGARR